jgi:subtilisin family serine protease
MVKSRGCRSWGWQERRAIVKKQGVILIAVTLLSVSLVVPMASSATEPETDTYLILFEDTHVPEDFSDQVTAQGGVVDFSHDVGIAIVSGLTDGAAAELGAREDINTMKANGGYALDPIVDQSVLPVGEGTLASSGDPTTASAYSWQWNMRAINAADIWATGRLGSPSVTIAILDTGIDYLHTDLHGLVDLSRSVSLVPADDVLVAAYFPGRHPVTDLWAHGTHVAGTASSNSLITAGVTTQTTLIGVKVCGVATGLCEDSAIMQGILHAVDNGADVINISLGGYFAKNGEHLVGFWNRLFNYARRMGVTVVVSAGNESTDLDHDGSAYAAFCNTPNTICVSATGPIASDNIYVGPWYEVDSPAFYTNFGSSAITVAAPGGSFNGFIWAPCSSTSLYLPQCASGTRTLAWLGTSMAAPHVSGLAALVIEDIGRNPGRVKTIIQNGADDLGKRGVDPYYGHGRINVAETVP